MPSRASWFNPTVYRKHVTRFAPLWLLYLLLWLVMLPFSILSRTGAGADFATGDLQYLVLRAALESGGIINLIYAGLIAMALHAWYYSTRSVNAMAALPIRREAYCVTNFLTALSMFLIPNLVVALLTWAAAASAGLPGFVISAQFLGIVTLEFLFYYGLAALCSAIVGQLAALPLLYLLFNFAAIVLNYVTVAVLSAFVYGMQESGYTLLGRFSPAYYITSRLNIVQKFLPGEDYAYYCVFHGWKYLLTIAAVGVLLLIAALLLFRYRRMESAGDVIAIPVLRPVFKYCFTIFCSMVLGVLAALTFFSGYDGPPLPAMVLCLLAGGFLGYFTSEILLKKSFQVFRREWIGFSVFGVCLLVAVVLMEFDVFGFERRIPDVSEVESITLDGSALSDDVIITDEAYITDLITLHQMLVSDKAEQERLAKQLPSHREEIDYTTIEIVYQLKNGKTLSRSYRICCTEAMWLDPESLPHQYAELLRDPYIIYLENTPAFEVSAASLEYSFLNIYDPETMTYRSVELSTQELYELYTDCIVPDLQEGIVGYAAPFFFEDTASTEYMADVYLEFSHTLDRVSPEQGSVTLSVESIDIVPTVGSRTAAWLEEHGCQMILRSEAEALEAARQAAELQ